MRLEKTPPPSESAQVQGPVPSPPIDRWMGPFVRFLAIESASGVVLLACTIAALVAANSPWAEQIAEFWRTRCGFALGEFSLVKPLLLWINDGLMAIFFFVVGLEIKREIVAGELRDPRKAALPIMAALGGMVAPAMLYLSLRGDGIGRNGWAIPMATDIAFVVGFLALLGPRVPLGLKILLLSLAIADDMGAVIVIACFFSTSISLAPLALAALGLALVCLMNRAGVRSIPAYSVVGALVWLGFLKSGVHPTVAGVLLGLLTPARPSLGELVSPLERLETALHPWVAFAIMPIFALANAGVRVEPTALTHPVALSVAAGLFFGKPLGIVVFSWLAVKVGLARLPSGVNWPVMIGAGCLAGIGFTMSLFIAGLALEGDLLDAGKIGTLLGSTASAIVGLLLLVRFLPKVAPPSS